MTEALKALIENAPVKTKGIFRSFLLVSNGKYDGFWGANGFNNILIFGKVYEEGNKIPSDDAWYKISEYGDAFSIMTGLSGVPLHGFHMDIPEEYEVPRIWFDTPISIDNEIPVSTIIGYTVSKHTTDVV